MPSPLVVFYAAGGGIGHLVRALALGRRLIRRGLRVRVLSNCSFHGRLAGDGVPVDYVESEGRSTEAVAMTFLRRLTELKPDLLVVDCFPGGLGGELRAFELREAIPKVLVARPRRLAPRPGDLAPYDLVLVPDEEEPSLGPGTTAIDPILIRDFDELFDREEARRRLGVSHERVLLVGHHGYPGEAEHLFALVDRLGRRLRRKGWSFRYASLRPFPPEVPSRARVEHFPLIELLPAVDLFLGAAGYNSFHELRALALPAMFLPRSRSHDDQMRRARRLEEPASSPEGFESRLEELMEAVEEDSAVGQRMWGCRPWPRGAEQATRAIEALLNPGTRESTGLQA